MQLGADYDAGFYEVDTCLVGADVGPSIHFLDVAKLLSISNDFSGKCVLANQ